MFQLTKRRNWHHTSLRNLFNKDGHVNEKGQMYTHTLVYMYVTHVLNMLHAELAFTFAQFNQIMTSWVNILNGTFALNLS